MPPYAHALRDLPGLPVFDIYSLITWLRAGGAAAQLRAVRRPGHLSRRHYGITVAAIGPASAVGI
jgi:hypothetical protein